jgi:cystathionine beta-synthase
VLRSMPPQHVITAQVDSTIAKAVSDMKEHGISQLPVLDGERLVGIVTESDLLQVLVSGRARLENSLAEVMVRRVSTLSVHEPASSLPERFNQGEVGLVLDEQQRLVGIVTKMDLIEFLSRRRGVVGA